MTRRHELINESSVEIHIWGSGSSENLGGVVDGTETKKLEDDERVLVLAVSDYFSVYLWNLIVFAFL